jgi:hypothetical protein
LKGELEKYMNLFMQNMKPYVSHDEGGNISKSIMGCNPFYTMGATKKVDHKCNESKKSLRMGTPNLVCNATKEKTFNAKWKDGMTM